MKSVPIADLKNNLSRYLRQVRHGEEILICDRKTPIAKIVALDQTQEFEARLIALAAEGLARLPKKRIGREFFTRFKPPRGPRVPLKRLIEVVTAERDED